MNTLVTSLVMFQGLVFLAWAALMFACLFRLRRDAVRETGATFPGVGATLQSFAGFLRLPEYRRHRRWLGGLTLVLCATILVQAFVIRP